MKGVLLLVVLTSATQPAASQSTRLEPRPFHEIQRELRSLLRRELSAPTKAERAAAIYQITQLYEEIRRDPRFPTSDTLKKYKARLWGRLTRVKRDIEQELSRRRRGRSERQTADDPSEQAALSLADALSVAGSISGGPANLLSQAQGASGGGAIPDYGPELVSLIHRTITPEFWDVHGGPGTIVYYRPLMVLVVRATDDVHHRLGGAVGGLRRAGR